MRSTVVILLVGVLSGGDHWRDCGLFQGFWVAVVGIPSFVVTLAGLLAFSGIGLVLTNSQTVVVTNDMYNALGSSSISAFDGGYLTPNLIGSGTQDFHLSLGMLLTIIVGLAYTAYLLVNARGRRREGLDTQPSAALIGFGLGLTVAGLVIIDVYRSRPRRAATGGLPVCLAHPLLIRSAAHKVWPPYLRHGR